MFLDGDVNETEALSSDVEYVASFNNDEEAIAAVTNSIAVLDRSHGVRVRIAGKERAAFVDEQAGKQEKAKSTCGELGAGIFWLTPLLFLLLSDCEVTLDENQLQFDMTKAPCYSSLTFLFVT